MDLSNGVTFQFNNIGLENPMRTRTNKNIKSEDFLKIMLQSKSKNFDNGYLIKEINSETVQILDNSIMSEKTDATHCGLMQYIYYAWANELGVVLKPDVFFYTIISEIRDQIVCNPENYREIFTKTSGKQKLEIYELTIEKLVDCLKDHIPNQQFFDIITKTSFTTAPTHFSQVLAITMADMATPYYDYITLSCGIPKITVLGKKIDWLELILSVLKLRKIFLNSSIINTYLVKVSNLIDKFYLAFINKNDKFFENIFTLVKNPMCGSGHSPVVINGWICDLYINNPEYINAYPSHLSCLPYMDEDKHNPNNNSYYYYTTGLTSSQIIDGFLYPEFNIQHCMIKHKKAEKIFNILASKK